MNISTRTSYILVTLLLIAVSVFTIAVPAIFTSSADDARKVQLEIESLRVMGKAMPESLVNAPAIITVPDAVNLFRDVMVDSGAYTELSAVQATDGIASINGLIVGGLVRYVVIPVSHEACAVITPGYQNYTSLIKAAKLLKQTGLPDVCIVMTEYDSDPELAKLVKMDGEKPQAYAVGVIHLVKDLKKAKPAKNKLQTI